MNAIIVSAEAKSRLTEAVRNYKLPPPEKYRALEEVKDCIVELRDKKASYQTIRAMLHDNAGIEVSHQTVARYCREVLESSKPKKPRRPKTPATGQPASVQEQLATRPAHRGFKESMTGLNVRDQRAFAPRNARSSRTDKGKRSRAPLPSAVRRGRSTSAPFQPSLRLRFTFPPADPPTEA